MMSKKTLLKKIEVGGVEVVLKSLDGVSWSTNVADLRRLQAERRELMASTQRAFRSIGSIASWGSGSSKRRAL